MAKTNEQLYAEADVAVNALYADKSVSQSKCRENLETLRGEIDTMLNSLETDDAG